MISYHPYLFYPSSALLIIFDMWFSKKKTSDFTDDFVLKDRVLNYLFMHRLSDQINRRQLTTVDRSTMRITQAK